MIDLHSHILPFLDDGSPDWSESLSMASTACKDGIKSVVCTPHHIGNMYENDREVIIEQVELFRKLLNEHHIPIQIVPGSEVRFDYDLHDKIEENVILTINDQGRYLLLELTSEFDPVKIENFIWDLKVNGITVILAHPERNKTIVSSPIILNQFILAGALVQITGGSLWGHFGKTIKRYSDLLLLRDQVHAIATDAHDARRRKPILSKAYEEVVRLTDTTTADRLLYETPEKIIHGETITIHPPKAIRSSEMSGSLFKRFFFQMVVFGFMLIGLSGCLSGGIYPTVSLVASADSTPESGQSANVRKISVSESFFHDNRRDNILKRSLEKKENYMLRKFAGKQIVFPSQIEQEDKNLDIYHIGVDDELYVYVWENPNLTMDVLVRRDGYISLPLIGSIRAAGLTVNQLERTIKHNYSAYIENPQVTVTPKMINSLRFFLTGAVKISTITQGPIRSGYPLRGDHRLLTALSQIEILDNADLAESFIIRDKTVIPVDLNALFNNGDLTQNVLLNPNDTVVIPARVKEISILGEVGNPGRFKVKRQTRVMDALAEAGGIRRETAVLNMSFISRGGEIIPVDFKGLLENQDLEQNIYLENDDTIYIPSNQENKIIVLGEVGKPGVINFVGDIDVMEAVSRAQGFLPTANRSQVVVMRGMMHKPQIYAINALRMMKGDLSGPFNLERYDLVYIPRTYIADWNVFISQLIPTAVLSSYINNLTD